MKNGWQIKQVGDLCKVIAGQSPKGKFYNTGGQGMAFYQGKKDFGEKFIEAPTKWTTQTTKIAQEGDVLMSVRAPVGPVNFATSEVCIGRGLAAIRCGDELERDFLFYHLLYLQPEIAGKEGAVFASINKSEIEALPIAFAPLPEQQRIVGILDEAFAGIATAKANAERNLQNARALFESHLQSVFTQRGPGWVETTLGEAYDVRDGTHDSPKYHATGYPLITSKNLKREGLSFDDVRLISEQDYTKINERSAVHKGDVLFAMIGTIGNPTLVEVEPNFAIKNVALFKNPNGQSGAFLKHYLDSGMVISKMMKEAKGTTQKFVGLGYLRGFPINLPPLATQLKLVEELDKLSEETQSLARLYERKLATLEALKKSLLHHAFTGEL